MKYLLIIFTWIATVPVHAADICGDFLGDPRFAAYVEAMLPTDMDLARIEAMAPKLHDEYLRAVAQNRGTFRGDQRSLEFLLENGFVHFQLAFSLHNRSWIGPRDQQLRQLANALNRAASISFAPADFVPSLVHLQADAEIEEAFAVAPFVQTRGASILNHFLMMLYHEPSRTISFGPREMSLLREAFQYAHIQDNDRALHVGLKSPAVVTALKHYLPHVEVSGIRTGAFTEAERQWAANFGVTLRSGRLDDANLREALLRGGEKFRLILALDATGPQFSPDQLMPWLAPHGSIVIINDYDLPPPMNEEDARAAGLQVLSWGKDRTLPRNVARLLYGATPRAGAGQLRAYVLRWGVEDSERRPAKFTSVGQGPTAH